MFSLGQKGFSKLTPRLKKSCFFMGAVLSRGTSGRKPLAEALGAISVQMNSKGEIPLSPALISWEAETEEDKYKRFFWTCAASTGHELEIPSALMNTWRSCMKKKGGPEERK